MESKQRISHWDNIYQTKSLNEVSWYQPKPETSLNLIRKSTSKKTDRIIDIGGGDSFLVDHLLDEGYTNITVLDISARAIERAKERLGDNAKRVNWIIEDIAHFSPTEKYDVWHDRAAFHFLTQEEDIKNYKTALNAGIAKGGTLILGTFSENGPLKCSGIPIKQYSELELSKLTSEYFTQEECFTIDHNTPFNSIQNFIFGRFTKL